MTNTNDMRAAFEQIMSEMYGPNVNLNRMQTMAGGLADEYKSPRVDASWKMYQWQSQQAQGGAMAWLAEKEHPKWDERGDVVVGSTATSKILDTLGDAEFFRDQLGYSITPLSPPAPAAVPEGWRLVPVEPTLGMLAALAWAGDEDLALGHAEINREIISNYGAMLAASPAPDHTADVRKMDGWISVKEQTPSQGERVLLKIDLEDCPVVGYWGCGRYEACTVNMEVSCGAFCYGGNVEGSFDSDEATHWMPLPNPPQQEEAER